MDARDREMAVEERIRATLLDRNVAVYWPEHFTSVNLGTREEILDALAVLVHAGKLEPRVQVRSGENHICWEGSPEAFGRLAPFTCEECVETIDHPRAHAVVYFRVAPRWRQAIEAEKKSPLACAL